MGSWSMDELLGVQLIGLGLPLHDQEPTHTAKPTPATSNSTS